MERSETPEVESDRAERDRVRRDPEVVLGLFTATGERYSPLLSGESPTRAERDGLEYFPDFDPRDPSESFGGDPS